MDHQNTNTTLRTKKILADDEIEELELDSFIQDKQRDTVHTVEDIIEPEEKTQTLNKRDYGNFALLVTLCKLVERTY
jgi:hypothetical protein